MRTIAAAWCSYQLARSREADGRPTSYGRPICAARDALKDAVSLLTEFSRDRLVDGQPAGPRCEVRVTGLRLRGGSVLDCADCSFGLYDFRIDDAGQVITYTSGRAARDQPDRLRMESGLS